MNSDKNAWQGTSGVALHLRNNSMAELFGSGSIHDITASGSIVYVEASSYNMEMGSGIRGNNGNLIGVQLAGPAGATAVIDGEITGVKDSAIHMNDGSNKNTFSGTLECKIDTNATIHGNSGDPWGTVTVQTNNGKLDIYGKIVNNYSGNHSGIYMAHNIGLTTVTLHSGATVSENYAVNGTAGIFVGLGNLTMEDGVSVTNNVSACRQGDAGAGVFVSEGGHFTMAGGTVSGNVSAGSNAGVSTMPRDWSQDGNVNVSQSSQAILNGGNITNNFRKAAVSKNADGVTATATGGVPSTLSISGTADNFGHQGRFLSVSNAVSLDHP